MNQPSKLGNGEFFNSLLKQQYSDLVTATRRGREDIEQEIAEHNANKELIDAALEKNIADKTKLRIGAGVAAGFALAPFLGPLAIVAAPFVAALWADRKAETERADTEQFRPPRAYFIEKKDDPDGRLP